MSIRNRRRRGRRCANGVNKNTGACLVNPRRGKSRKRRSSACRFGKVQGGPRAGKCRKVRVKPCKLYGAFRRADGRVQVACAGRSVKALANKRWPASFTGVTVTPTEFRARRAARRAAQRASRGASRAQRRAARQAAAAWGGGRGQGGGAGSTAYQQAAAARGGRSANPFRPRGYGAGGRPQGYGP